MMRHKNMHAFLARARSIIGKGPVALIMVEDEIEVASTLRHHRNAGFRTIVLFAASDLDLPDLDLPDLAPQQEQQVQLHRVDCDIFAAWSVPRVVNAVIAAVPGAWMYYGYNAEYLFYPFCEQRTVGELLAFVAEERRASVLTFVIDIYAGDLAACPGAVSREDACLDKAGYYALNRKDRDNNDMERQYDFFGGFRWRFEEHIPQARRKIDRVALFRSRPGLHLRDDHTFDDAEYNTYACPWHNSPTAALCSFRAAKALRRNPASRDKIATFRWQHSVPFTWDSEQLLNLGLMEPGQWF